jgi:hypothetical protein
MGKTHPPISEDDQAKELVRLCRAGRLYEIEKWANDGKSLEISSAIKRGRKRSLDGATGRSLLTGKKAPRSLRCQSWTRFQ